MPPKKEAPAPEPAPAPSVVETSEAITMNGKFVFVDDSIYEGEYIELILRKYDMVKEYLHLVEHLISIMVIGKMI